MAHHGTPRDNSCAGDTGWAFKLTQRTMQVIQAGHASCTGLSIFLVNALRAVGIPARMAGMPFSFLPSTQHCQCLGLTLRAGGAGQSGPVASISLNVKCGAGDRV